MTIGQVTNNSYTNTILNNLNRTQQILTKSFENLSSGLRINSAKDDAASLSLSNRMQVRIQGLNEAYNNIQSGINMVNTAEGGLSGITENLQKIRQLTLQAGGTQDKNTLQSIQAEISQNIQAISGIANNTQFGNTYLLNGNASAAAGIRPGTPNRGVNVDNSNLTTRENYFTIRQVQQGSSSITTGDAKGTPQVMNSGVANQQDIAVTAGAFNLKTTGAAAAGNTNLANTTFNGANLQAGGSISFQGVLADGKTKYSGTFAISAGTDIAGGGGTGASLASTIQAAINTAEKQNGIDTTGGTNTGETNVRFNATNGRMEFVNGANQGVSNFDIQFTTKNAAGKTQNTTEITRAAEINGTASGAQTGNSINSITNSTFATGDLTMQISNVVAAQQRTVQSNNNFTANAGNPVTASTNLVGSVFNGATLAQGDTINIKGANADGSTFNNVITVSTVSGATGSGAAVTFGDLLAEMNNRDRSTVAGNKPTGFTESTASLTSAGQIQVTDDIAKTSKTNFTMTVNDRSGGGGTFGTIADSAKLVREGTEQTATVRINNGPSQTVKAGQTATLNGNSSGGNTPSLTMKFGANLTEGADTINNTRAAFTGSLNGGPQVRFEAGQQNVNFVSGIRRGEGVTLDFGTAVNVPNPGANGMGTVIISATGRQLNFQTGANAGNQFAMTLGDFRPEALGFGQGNTLNDINITQDGGVDKALNIIDQALSQVDQTQGQIGAYSNRLESTANNLSVSAENLTASQSRIRDLNYASEITKLTMNQMLIQSGALVLSQTNQLQGNLLSQFMR